MKHIPEIDVYIRFCETDAAGHVNNTSYFIYMEEARTKFFEAIGFGRSERSNVDFIIASTQCDFLAQSYAGENLSISTSVAKVGYKSFMITHEIKTSDKGAIVALGTAVIVCFNFQAQETVSIPSGLRSVLEKCLAAV
ncbi:acyl-CoA thioesterase [Psychrobacillus sp. NPDC096426]|uniref:acyl-CoA thioesterase n=1 Tax=Psychrobacillus sp. NPDC096426 TaxID=3364491 RepID=UPI003815A6AA